MLTWEQQQKTYLDAVKNEKVMITFILLLVCEIIKNGTTLQEEHDLTV